MKTQKFGVSSEKLYCMKDPSDHRAGRLDVMDGRFHAARCEAGINWREMRINGEGGIDWPSFVRTHGSQKMDGSWQWDTSFNVSGAYSKIKYIPGPKDEALAALIDRIYIARLERNGCSNKTEEQDLIEWRDSHLADYASGPRGDSSAQTFSRWTGLGAAAVAENDRSDFLKSRYENDPAYQKVIDAFKKSKKSASSTEFREALPKQTEKIPYTAEYSRRLVRQAEEARQEEAQKIKEAKAAEELQERKQQEQKLREQKAIEEQQRKEKEAQAAKERAVREKQLQEQKKQQAKFAQEQAEKAEREKQEQERKAELARQAQAREKAIQDAKKAEAKKEATYQRELKGYRDLGGPGLVEAVKAKVSDRLIADILRLDPEHIDSLDELGQAALHIAAGSGDIDRVKQLIEAGANPVIEDGLDQTPRDLAKAAKHAKVAQYLKVQEQKTSQSSTGSSASKGSDSTDQGSPTASLGSSGVGRIPPAPPTQPQPLLPPAPPAVTSPSAAPSAAWQINYRDLKWGNEIGKGAFGVVYRGEYLHSAVAIKQLLGSQYSAQALKELRDEAAMLAPLRSEFLIRFYGVASQENNHVLVMEYVSGGSLFNYLQDGKQNPTWPQRLTIASDISKGLDFLHHHNIEHRDLKSLNILLDDRFRAKITDFGLARVKTESTSMTTQGGGGGGGGQAAGTIRWMAPECFKRKAKRGKPTDVYALGMVFWEIASRQIPYADESNNDVVRGFIKDGELEDIPEDCPQALGTLILQCWQMNPDERPTAVQVIDQLAVLDGQGLFASTPSYQSNLSSGAAAAEETSTAPQYQDNVMS